MNLNLVVGTFVRLTADEPDRARRDIEQAMASWSQQGFHVQHMNRLHDEVQIDLYRGEGRAAWDRMSEGWPIFAASHFFRVQQMRIFMWHQRARAALAAAVSAVDPTPLLRAAERDAHLLQKEGVPWAAALARLIHAGAALARGSPDAAVRLREAAAGLDTVDMPLHAAAARRILGAVLSGADGQALVAAADAWMHDQKIQNPARLTAMLAPGMPGPTACS